MIYESFKFICSAPPAGGRWEEVTLCSILVYFQLVSLSDRRKIENNHLSDAVTLLKSFYFLCCHILTPPPFPP